jgi:hypothetical protein
MKMLEYIKMILDKVSFDSKLFEKELKKGLKELKLKQLLELLKLLNFLEIFYLFKL